jgi:DNA repair protein RadA/Sms
MTRSKLVYRCQECGWAAPKWVGRCGGCQDWGTVREVAEGVDEPVAVAPEQPARPITAVDPAAVRRRLTGIGELDRVLGGGLVPGSVVLLAGEPGVGKSTLLLTAAASWAEHQGRALYLSGEESSAQIRLRAERVGAEQDDLYLASETDLGRLLGQIEQVAPSLVVVDSVQTIGPSSLEGQAGSTAQVKAVATALARVAKRLGLPVILVGQVTKDGSVAGPRALEHLVDVVIGFEGDPQSGFRMLRATKNRFGSVDEVGCFELTAAGLQEVPDPSGRFTSRHGQPVAGASLVVAMEGRRPLVAEIQALVAPATGVARRVAHGLDPGRLAMVLAVLRRRCRAKLGSRDVYVSTVGGAKVQDPAADLALAVAIMSALRDEPVPAGCLALGEIGLAGELRPVPDLAKRLAEAARLGHRQAIVPAGGLGDWCQTMSHRPIRGPADRTAVDNTLLDPAAPRRHLAAVAPGTVLPGAPQLRLIEAASLAEALDQLGLGPAERHPLPADETFGPAAKWGRVGGWE